MITKHLQYLIEDYKFYNENKRYILSSCLNINFYINIFFRISNLLYQLHLYPLAKVFWLTNRIVFAVDIDPGAKLSGGFKIIHGIGIVVGRNTVTTGRMTMYHGATIGGNTGKYILLEGKKMEQPLIKDNVIVGINSTVLGPIIIEKNVRIGSNSVVTKDVLENLTVIGTNRYLQQK